LSVQKLKDLLDKLILQPKVFTCNLYLDQDGNVGASTAVIVPTKFKVIEDGIQIAWSCNLLESCSQKRCIYSKK
jgi:hypothetical protein